MPVLSEADYLASGQRVFKRLNDAFATSNVLILGASVTDPPLVRALLESRASAEEAGLQRFAVLPRADVEANTDTDDSYNRLRSWQLRLSHLGVQGVFVDHLSQVGQLLREVAVSISEPDYAHSDSCHGDRLHRWWAGWAKGIDTPAGFDPHQQTDHDALRDVLPLISKKLGADHEQLKVEVWLRWKPDGGERELRLWASSFARFTNPDQTRFVSLNPSDTPSAEDKNSALEAFKLGRPYHMELPKDVDARWKSYLSAPIQLSGGEVNLVVGSVVIASMKGGTESHLGAKQPRRRQATALSIAQIAAVKIASGNAENGVESAEG